MSLDVVLDSKTVRNGAELSDTVTRTQSNRGVGTKTLTN